MIGAVIRENIVENLVIIKEAQLDSMAEALGCEIINAAPYGLQVGDLRTAKGWTRNVNGEQVVLPALDAKEETTFTLQQERISALEESAAMAEEAAAAEALAILSGEVSE